MKSTGKMAGDGVAESRTSDQLQLMRIFSNGCNDMRFADVRLFCSFLMTFGINICWNDLAGIQRKIPERTEMNCYLTSKKFALMEMAMEPF